MRKYELSSWGTLPWPDKPMEDAIGLRGISILGINAPRILACPKADEELWSLAFWKGPMPLVCFSQFTVGAAWAFGMNVSIVQQSQLPVRPADDGEWYDFNRRIAEWDVQATLHPHRDDGIVR